MIIKDPEMLKKMERALDESGNIYTLDDIESALSMGKMQSHVFKDTWAITEVQDYPNSKRVVHVLYVVGDLSGAFGADKKVDEWARNIGADRMTAIGREGWEKFTYLGWNKSGTFYTKDI